MGAHHILDLISHVIVLRPGHSMGYDRAFQGYNGFIAIKGGLNFRGYIKVIHLIFLLHDPRRPGRPPEVRQFVKVHAIRYGHVRLQKHHPRL